MLANIVDCEWDEWKTGECDEPCGGGMRTNTRIPKVDAQHGGEECTGSSSITESCNQHECPGIHKNIRINFVSDCINTLTDVYRCYVLNVTYVL